MFSSDTTVVLRALPLEDDPFISQLTSIAEQYGCIHKELVVNRFTRGQRDYFLTFADKETADDAFDYLGDHRWTRNENNEAVLVHMPIRGDNDDVGKLIIITFYRAEFDDPGYVFDD